MSILLLFAAYKNFKLKDLIIIPGIMDKVITGSLIGALVLFFLVAYMINANVFGYLFAICTWILFYTLMTCTGFTKEHLIYYGGINIFLSKKKISELKYLKVDYLSASGRRPCLVRLSQVRVGCRAPEPGAPPHRRGASHRRDRHAGQGSGNGRVPRAPRRRVTFRHGFILFRGDAKKAYVLFSHVNQVS